MKLIILDVLNMQFHRKMTHKQVQAKDSWWEKFCLVNGTCCAVKNVTILILYKILLKKYLNGWIWRQLLLQVGRNSQSRSYEWLR